MGWAEFAGRSRGGAGPRRGGGGDEAPGAAVTAKSLGIADPFFEKARRDLLRARNQPLDTPLTPAEVQQVRARADAERQAAAPPTAASLAARGARHPGATTRTETATGREPAGPAGAEANGASGRGPGRAGRATAPTGRASSRSALHSPPMPAAVPGPVVRPLRRAVLTADGAVADIATARATGTPLFVPAPKVPVRREGLVPLSPVALAGFAADEHAPAVVVGDPRFPFARRLGPVLDLFLWVAPRTKKNSKEALQRTSLAYRRYRNWSARYIAGLAEALGLPLPPIEYNVTALFFTDTDPDTDGLKTGLADVLQDAGVILNDKQLRTWEGTDAWHDPTFPRVEIRLSPYVPLGLTRLPLGEPWVPPATR